MYFGLCSSFASQSTLLDSASPRKKKPSCPAPFVPTVVLINKKTVLLSCYSSRPSPVLSIYIYTNLFSKTVLTNSFPNSNHFSVCSLPFLRSHPLPKCLICNTITYKLGSTGELSTSKGTVANFYVI